MLIYIVAGWCVLGIDTGHMHVRVVVAYDRMCVACLKPIVCWTFRSEGRSACKTETYINIGFGYVLRSKCDGSRNVLLFFACLRLRLPSWRSVGSASNFVKGRMSMTVRPVHPERKSFPVPVSSQQGFSINVNRESGRKSIDVRLVHSARKYGPILVTLFNGPRSIASREVHPPRNPSGINAIFDSPLKLIEDRRWHLARKNGPTLVTFERGARLIKVRPVQDWRNDSPIFVTFESGERSSVVRPLHPPRKPPWIAFNFDSGLKLIDFRLMQIARNASRLTEGGGRSETHTLIEKVRIDLPHF